MLAVASRVVRSFVLGVGPGLADEHGREPETERGVGKTEEERFGT